MEFPETVMKMMIQEPSVRTPEKIPGSPKFRWKISFHRSPKPSSPASSPFSLRFPKPKQQTQQLPSEFLCPVSGALMADPVIVSSGHTFERASVDACKFLGFLPPLPDGAVPDFSAVIPNLALKSTILCYCRDSRIPPPKPLDFSSADSIVRKLMTETAQKDAPAPPSAPARASGVARVTAVTEAEISRPATVPVPSSSDELGSSSSSSSEMEPEPAKPEEEELITKLKSSQIFEIEEAVISLRRITRAREDRRVSLCTDRVLSTLRSLIVSRYSIVQVNSVAAPVNLSLEKVNKIKIVRAGMVPNLIEVLRWGFPESQEHASGALFSLALDDHNKTAIGVLGALSPLMNLLRSGTERAQNDSALALYHLTLVQSNRAKILKTGSIPGFVDMVRSGRLVDRVLLIMCNLGLCPEGRAALLDAGAVECLVKLLDGSKLKSGSTRENCLTALLSLSRAGPRFKVIAKATGAVNMLQNVESDKSRLLLDIITGNGVEKEEEEMDWEKLLSSTPPSPQPNGSTG